MKPTKNWNYCLDCGRKKMLFESEGKVRTFIKFNGEEVAAQAGVSVEDLRPYYCEACGGWHFSSKKKYDAKSKSEKMIDFYDKADGCHYSISEIYNITDELYDYAPNAEKWKVAEFFDNNYPNINQKTRARVICKFFEKIKRA